jgi:hypothetical protein
MFSTVGGTVPTPLVPDLVDQPWNAQPPGSLPFSQPFVIALPAIGSGETPVLGTNGKSGITCPVGWGGGVINYLSCSTNVPGFVDGSGSLIFRVRINQNSYVKNYDNIQVRLGIPPFPGDTKIVLGPGDFVEWTVTNVSQGGGASQVMCFFRGYFWPVQQ